MIDHEAILRQIPTEEKTLTPPPSVFHARIHPFKRSPIMLRPRKSRKVRNSCGSGDVVFHEDPQSPSGSSDEGSDLETPSKPSAPTKGFENMPATVHTSQATEQSDTRHRQYCTQACLLGLVRGTQVDQACPNAAAHGTQGADRRHALDQKTLARQIRIQLKENPDGCELLGKQGARGALFKLTLESDGYTFVAKGSVEAFVPKLKHEGACHGRVNGHKWIWFRVWDGI